MLSRRTLLLTVPAAGLVAATPSLAAPRAGSFTGASGHEVRGSVVLDGRTLTLSDDFYLDGAPDAGIGLGQGGEYDRRTWIERLDSLTGTQTYELNRRTEDPGAYDTVFIWCRLFSVPLGVAALG